MSTKLVFAYTKNENLTLSVQRRFETSEYTHPLWLSTIYSSICIDLIVIIKPKTVNQHNYYVLNTNLALIDVTTLPMVTFSLMCMGP